MALKDTWHYKLAYWWNIGSIRKEKFAEEIGLCPYFWMVIQAILVTIFYPIMLVFIGCLFTFAMYECFIMPFSNQLAGAPTLAYCAIKFIGVMFWLCLFAGIRVGTREFKDEYKICAFLQTAIWKTPEKTKKEKSPNLFWEYLKARKNKFCPKLKVNE